MCISGESEPVEEKDAAEETQGEEKDAAEEKQDDDDLF